MPDASVYPPLSANEVERRIASYLRTVHAYRLPKAVVNQLASSYLRCMEVAHRVLPAFDLTYAIALGSRRPRTNHGVTRSAQRPAKRAS